MSGNVESIGDQLLEVLQGFETYRENIEEARAGYDVAAEHVKNGDEGKARETLLDTMEKERRYLGRVRTMSVAGIQDMIDDLDLSGLEEQEPELYESLQQHLATLQKSVVEGIEARRTQLDEAQDTVEEAQRLSQEVLYDVKTLDGGAWDAQLDIDLLERGIEQDKNKLRETIAEKDEASLSAAMLATLQSDVAGVDVHKAIQDTMEVQQQAQGSEEVAQWCYGGIILIVVYILYCLFIAIKGDFRMR